MQTRVADFDVVKGVAIFMVVMGHSLLFAFPDVPEGLLFVIIRTFHMPLFFFVSGWWMGRRDLSSPVAPRQVGIRAVRLLPPMLFVAFLWTLAMPATGVFSEPLTFPELLMSASKGGYWFPWSLFLVTVAFAALTYFWGASLWRRALTGVAVWLILTAAARLLPDGVSDFLSLHSVRLHFPAYFIGVLAAQRAQQFYSFISRPAVTALSVLSVAAAVGAFCHWPDMPSAAYLVLYQLCIIPLFFVVFRVVNVWCASPSPAVEGWAYLGRRSFSVYLLHYFFLFPAGFLGQFASTGFVPSLIAAVAYSAAVVATVLLFDRILRPARPLAYLLCGDRL